jgi:hypothetical protein
MQIILQKAHFFLLKIAIFLKKLQIRDILILKQTQIRFIF